MNHAPAKPATPPRLIVPDLARGLALAGIAMANAVQSWVINGYDAAGEPGWTLGGVRPGVAADAVAAVFSAMFVHVRGLPMFSTLLGFGIGLISANLYRRGYPPRPARRVLARRYGILALFGLAHMFLLFHGDIMFYYGLIGVVVSLLFTLRSKWLRVIAYVVLLGHAAFTTMNAVGLYFLAQPQDFYDLPFTASLVTYPAYLEANADSGLAMLTNAPFAVIQLGGLVILGYVWAREGYLVNVSGHRRVLWAWVAVGTVVAVGIGVPWSLSATGVLSPQLEQTMFWANLGWGLFTGPAILAGLALATNGVQQRMYARAAATGDATAPGWAYPFVALGKRSMSGYLAQTFVFLALVMPFGLGVGLGASASEKLLIGFGVWLTTLALAVVCEHFDIPGPFEQLHRRLSYGPTKRLEPYTPGRKRRSLGAWQKTPIQKTPRAERA